MVVKPDDSGYRKIVQTFVRKVCGARSEKHQFYAFRIFSFTSWNEIHSVMRPAPRDGCILSFIF